MTNEWLVPILVVGIVGVILVMERRSVRPLHRRRPRPVRGREMIARLEDTLGVGILVHEVQPGPPVRIVATGVLDGASSGLMGVGPTEDEAWDDLARAAIVWKRDDGRNIRTYIGGA
jgi:hypothetical protein